MWLTHCFAIFGIMVTILIRLVDKKFCEEIKITPSNDFTLKTFYGKWVEGKCSLKQTCDLINKTRCCTKNHLKHLQHFVFHNDTLNSVDVAEEMRKVLLQKRILFAGDSMTRDFYQYIREFLSIDEPDIDKTKNASLDFLFSRVIYIKSR